MEADEDPFVFQITGAEDFLEYYWEYCPMIVDSGPGFVRISFRLHEFDSIHPNNYSAVKINDLGLNLSQWSECWIKVAEKLGCNWLEEEVAVFEFRKKSAHNWGRAMMENLSKEKKESEN